MNRPGAPSRAFLLLFALVAVYRVSLLGRGALAFVDEQRYFKSGLALQHLGGGDLHAAFADIADTDGRPGFPLVQLPAAALQGIPYALGIAPSNPRSLLIPTLANVVVSLVTLYFFSAICLILCGDERAALAASGAYALLVSSNVYVRHLFPYDWALACVAGAIWLALAGPPSLRRALAAGALCGGAVTIYPGYALLALTPVAAIAGAARRGDGPPPIRTAAAFAAGAGALVLAIELLCRAGGASFLASARTLGGTVTQGAFEEGWTFLPAYLIQVERWSGVVLLAGAAIHLWRFARRSGWRRPRAIDWLVLPALGAWIAQAAASAWLHQMVLYGRLIHPWMLFLALALAESIAGIGNRLRQAAACAAVLICAVGSWAPAAADYSRLAYPRDVLYAQRIDTAQVSPDRFVCELEPVLPYLSPPPADRATNAPYTNLGARVVLMNFCQGLPPAADGAARAAGETDAGAGLPRFDGPHFLAFPAYGYEGFAPGERRALVERDYRVKVFDAGAARTAS
ncbi:MAG: hypothetical protein IT176_14840 [Acidobacteria bacterium]|nr:hypothetical protein [Acidobacteriota bacterium]